MPRADQITNAAPVKALIIGPSKAGKSRWAMQAAAAGYNVLYLDGDVAGATLSQQSLAIKKHVMYMDMRDSYVDGAYVPRFSALMKRMTHTSPYLWNDCQSRTFDPKQSDPEDDVWQIRLTRLGINDILVLDSISSLSYSIMRELATNAGIDLTDVDKAERTVYAEARNRLTGILNMLQAAPFNVICLAHPEEWEQRRKKPGLVKESSKEDNQVIIGTRMVASSVSKSFGATIPKFFTDAAWMSVSPTGTRELDFASGPDREAGGRFSDKQPVETYSFLAIAKAAQLPVPPPSDCFFTPGLVECKAASLMGENTPDILTPQTAAPKMAAPGMAGLGAIFAAKKEAVGR